MLIVISSIVDGIESRVPKSEIAIVGVVLTLVKVLMVVQDLVAFVTDGLDLLPRPCSTFGSLLFWLTKHVILVQFRIGEKGVPLTSGFHDKEEAYMMTLTSCFSSAAFIMRMKRSRCAYGGCQIWRLR